MFVPRSLETKNGGLLSPVEDEGKDVVWVARDIMTQIGRQGRDAQVERLEHVSCEIEKVDLRDTSALLGNDLVLSQEATIFPNTNSCWP